MITTIINALKANKRVSAYSITAKNTESSELFYVKQQLQCNRASNFDEYHVAVYADKDSLRGNASFVVDPYMDEATIVQKIDDAIEQALLAVNKFYELPSPTDDELQKNESNLEGKNFNELMTSIVPAVFRADCFENGSINATEIFLYKTNYHIVNSNGIDIKFTRYKGNIELIPSFVNGDEKFEVYKMVEFSSLDTKKITEEINEAMQEGLDRSKAAPLKLDNPNINVLIPASELSSFFGYFLFKLNYRSILTQSSDVKIGDFMQGECEGDKVSISLKPMIPSSPDSAPVDLDGVVLKDVNLVEDGIAKTYYGAFQYGYWMGIEKPTGNIGNIDVKPGSVSEDDMKKTPYLECVKFSGIQMDPFTGFFGGEVRLGYYFDGEKRIPVTGFCISGNIEEIKQSIRLSKEVKGSGNYQGPKYLCTNKFKIN